MERLVRFTQIDYDREMAFVAIDTADEQHEIRGIARYICNPDGKTAEFGVIVEDAWQGRGLGHVLMQALEDTARARGLAQLIGLVLRENDEMGLLMQRRGYGPHRDEEDPRDALHQAAGRRAPAAARRADGGLKGACCPACRPARTASHAVAMRTIVRIQALFRPPVTPVVHLREGCLRATAAAGRVVRASRRALHGRRASGGDSCSRSAREPSFPAVRHHPCRPSDFYPCLASRMSHLSRIDALVLEADITTPARRDRDAEVRDVRSGRGRLDKRLPDTLEAGGDGACARRAGSAADMRLKPWMLGSMLALFEAAQAGYVQGLAAEAYLSGLAKAGNRPILEFEGVEQQFALFETAPWSTQVAFLDEALKAVESNTARREISRIVRAWETADRPALERLLSEMQAATTVGARFTVDTILFGRHPAMVQRIEELMTDGRNYLFAVGSLHLAGPRGLVEMLRARGYTVTEL
jgi:uncharacterized protein YbaP (TraB family)/GNAT superfamily N-acetyltransferase